MIQSILKFFKSMSYKRRLHSILYRDNILHLWYGGADHYQYINIDGVWFKHSSMRRVDKDKQAELNTLVATYSHKGRGRQRSNA